VCEGGEGNGARWWGGEECDEGRYDDDDNIMMTMTMLPLLHCCWRHQTKKHLKK
jgi:hypothetical protein